MPFYYLSSRKLTICVEVDFQEKIIEAPPIARVFVGQKLEALIAWMVLQGGFVIEELKEKNS